ncbi:MAG: PQQ-like beta-propeller repeat protein [Candidatus Poribacteria bacterium]|nr:PQQ-like beta-propeller repeat protein [Candidatus Poribacteria bacterium]MDE0506365.1 PQQ-like beta-propeller repeat protein [Candidatus Poribacteria bacterium]
MKKFANLLAVSLLLISGISIAGATDWPQWRGPDKDGISRETGLLKEWPDGGPQVIWRVPLGEGFSGMSVVGGRVYTMFSEGDDEFVVCLDASNGEEIWRFRSDSNYQESMGGNGPRATPTIDGELLFTVTAQGKLYALNTANGAKVWSHDLQAEFGSKMPRWGVCTSPLVEGDLLLVEVGGKEGKSIVAFDKTNGLVVWSSHTDILGYSSPIAVTIGGIRQLIVFTGTQLVSVSPENGKLYWTYPWQTQYDVNAATPVFIPPDKIFISSGYGKGAAVVQIRVMDLTESSADIRAVEIWKNTDMKNHFATSVLHGDHLYGFDNAILKCIDANSGVEKWKTRGYGKGTLMLADDHLIILSDRGKLGLAEATPSAYTEVASAEVLSGLCWTVPTLANGRLYARNEKEMVCLEVTGPN